MRFVFLGLPGVGKGTQAGLLAEKYSIPKLSTGEILRHAVDSNTGLGMTIKEVMEAGQLVPDFVVEKIIKERLKEPDCKGGFIIDGFPRTLHQAKALDSILGAMDSSPTFIINIEMLEADLIKRLNGRYICQECKTVYNLESSPKGQDDVCPKCGGMFVHRPDDDKEAVKQRFIEYSKRTSPVVEFYKGCKGFVQVNGMRSIGEVFNDITSLISKALLTF